MEIFGVKPGWIAVGLFVAGPVGHLFFKTFFELFTARMWWRNYGFFNAGVAIALWAFHSSLSGPGVNEIEAKVLFSPFWPVLIAAAIMWPVSWIMSTKFLRNRVETKIRLDEANVRADDSIEAIRRKSRRDSSPIKVRREIRQSRAGQQAHQGQGG